MKCPTDDELVEMLLIHRHDGVDKFREYVSTVIALVRMNESVSQLEKNKDGLIELVDKLKDAIPQPEEEI